MINETTLGAALDALASLGRTATCAVDVNEDELLRVGSGTTIKQLEPGEPGPVLLQQVVYRKADAVLVLQHRRLADALDIRDLANGPLTVLLANLLGEVSHQPIAADHARQAVMAAERGDLYACAAHLSQVETICLRQRVCLSACRHQLRTTAARPYLDVLDVLRVTAGREVLWRAAERGPDALHGELQRLAADHPLRVALAAMDAPRECPVVGGPCDPRLERAACCEVLQ